MCANVPLCPRVSVLVAARNEENNIAACLRSLLLQDYPAHLLEIIVGNDASEDNTAGIVEDFIRRLPQGSPTYRLIHVTQRIGHCKGKANVLAHLAKVAEGEVFLFTDADVEVPPSWVSTMIEHWNPEIGIMTGFTIPEGRDLFSRLQALDWTSGLTAICKATEWGIPLTALGNNMLVSRAAYESIGGYEGIAFSLTEDHAIFKAITDKGWKFHHLMCPEITAKTLPMKTLKEYIHQRKRWTYGAMRLPWYAVMILFGQALLIPIILLWGVFYPFQAASVWAVKASLQSLLLLFALQKINRKQPLYAILLYEVYADIFYFIMLLTYILPFKVDWKGRKY
ncbi:MAG: glycosyltransferase [Flammeovirgaceae bacterium]|nr:glycosyltransferase [Flammeovirgaceae bacterium]